MPTMAQAMPTGSAVLAPSASESRQSRIVSRPPFDSAFQPISAASATATGRMPHSKNEAPTRPSATHMMTLSAGEGRPRMTEPPRISRTVSARPMVPANRGV